MSEKEIELDCPEHAEDAAKFLSYKGWGEILKSV